MHLVLCTSRVCYCVWVRGVLCCCVPCADWYLISGFFFEFHRGTTSRSSNRYAAVERVLGQQLRVGTRRPYQTTQIIRRGARDISSMIDMDGLHAPAAAGRDPHGPSYQSCQGQVLVVNTGQHHSYDVPRGLATPYL